MIQKLIEACRNGDAQAGRNLSLEILNDQRFRAEARAIHRKFLQGSIYDPQDIVNDAVEMFLEDIKEGRFTWQGEPQFRFYFNEKMRQVALNLCRKEQPKGIEIKSLFTKVLPGEEEEEAELVDLIGKEDKELQEIEAWDRIRQLEERVRQRGDEGVYRLFQAYKEIIRDYRSSIPGAHEVSKELRERLGISLATLSRWREELRKLLREILREDTGK